MTIDERLELIEKKLADLDARTLSLIRLGPKPISTEEINESVTRIINRLLEPVDRSARVLTDGRPETDDHREINPATGQQKGYIVLTSEERAKGFVRPVRRTYVHIPCGVVTTMAESIAETYARDPEFYNGTFCCGCKAHFPIGKNGQFKWNDGSMVGT